MDKYYTKSSVASYCCDLAKQKLHIHAKKDLVIEPSAGNGSFINPIKSICDNHIFIDIKPDHTHIIKANYLTKDFGNIPYKYNRVHVIGNPPFGFKGSLAIKFIKKTCTFSDTFSFILPRSFEKKSMKNSVPLYFHLVFSKILPKDSFVNKNVPCVFQIWEKRSYKRKESNPRIEPKRFIFTKNPSDADFAIRRVGSKAGHVYKEYLSLKNTNSHYFIKLEHKSDIKKIKNIVSQNKEFVTGPMSISKYDLTKKINKLLLSTLT